MRMNLPADKVQAAYPGYKGGTLIFGNCFLFVIGESHGPFKIARTTKPLSRFKSLANHTHLDIRLWSLSRLPVGIDRVIEKDLHTNLAAVAIKRDWFDLQLADATAALARANPLGPVLNLAGISYEEVKKTAAEHWNSLGLLSLDQERTDRT